MTKPILLFLLSLCCLQGVRAQDTHFTQYNTTPMDINPALTGIFDGNMRFSNNYRSQWGSIGDGYKTIYSSLDFPIGKGKSTDHYFGGGIMFNTDKAGYSEFYTTLVEGALSFTTALNDYSTHFMSIGFQAGLDQRGMDLTKNIWDNQWNGITFDPTQPTGENIQLMQFTFVEISAGALWYYLPDEYNMAYAGASFAHINTPNTSFYVDQIDEMPMRYTFHAGADLAVDHNENTTWICPKAIFMKQGKHQELTFGGSVKHKLILKSKYTNYRKEVLFTWGAAYRLNDAFLALARVDYGRFGLGVSYDVNTSSLGSKAGGTGTVELSLSYITPIHRGNVGAITNRMPKFF